MVSTTNHWIKSDNDNETKNLTPLMNDSADISTEFQPVWISLSLISSKSSFFCILRTDYYLKINLTLYRSEDKSQF